MPVESLERHLGCNIYVYTYTDTLITLIYLRIYFYMPITAWNLDMHMLKSIKLYVYMIDIYVQLSVRVYIATVLEHVLIERKGYWRDCSAASGWKLLAIGVCIKREL